MLCHCLWDCLADYCLESLVVCKVRPSLLDLHKVILNHIPNNGENTQMWLEFFTALNMQHKDMPPLLSEHDARWNVHIVLDAWLKGVGSEPKTWGTLLNAMRERGTPFLRDLADAAEEVYLSKPIHGSCVLCICAHLCSFAHLQESWRHYICHSMCVVCAGGTVHLLLQPSAQKRLYNNRKLPRVSSYVGCANHFAMISSYACSVHVQLLNHAY